MLALKSSLSAAAALAVVSVTSVAQACPVCAQRDENGVMRYAALLRDAQLAVNRAARKALARVAPVRIRTKNKDHEERRSRKLTKNSDPLSFYDGFALSDCFRGSITNWVYIIMSFRGRV